MRITIATEQGRAVKSEFWGNKSTQGREINTFKDKEEKGKKGMKGGEKEKKEKKKKLKGKRREKKKSNGTKFSKQQILNFNKGKRIQTKI